MITQPPSAPGQAEPRHAPLVSPGYRWARRVVSVLLIVTGLLTLVYSGISTYVASQMVYETPKAIVETPASLGLAYRDVTFTSREDNLQLKGWFIPGVLPGGQLTVDRAVIAVHGKHQNRTDPDAGLLDLSGTLARDGFAVLAFDMRGNGDSPPAAIGFGTTEQRDVLGAVDFLQTGSVPYPELGRPRLIGGLGISMGGAALVMAATSEPAIRAVVADSVPTDYAPVIERDLPDESGLPAMFTPGVILAARAMFGVDYYAARPVDYVAKIAPRPLFLIQGANDDIIPPGDLAALTKAASVPANARVTAWLVAHAKHAQSYHVMGPVYVNRVALFFTRALGPDTSQARP